MTNARNPWPLVVERRTHPLHDDKKPVAEHVRTLLTTDNLTELEKLLAAQPRLIGYARALVRNGGSR
jgi:hypothetical protein